MSGFLLRDEARLDHDPQKFNRMRRLTFDRPDGRFRQWIVLASVPPRAVPIGRSVTGR